MRAEDIREMAEADITSRIAELEEERFRLKFRAATETLEDPLRLRSVRRDIARLKTVRHEKVLGQGATKTAKGSARARVEASGEETAEKKPAATKSAAKKSAAKKSAAKKSAAKKTATKSAVKSTARRSTAKPAARKSAAKRSAAKQEKRSGGTTTATTRRSKTASRSTTKGR